MTPVSRAFDLSGFGVRIRGLDPECAAVLDDVWGLFAGDGGRPVAEFEVRRGEGTLTPGRIDDAPLQRTIDGRAIAFASAEGRVECDAGGRAQVRVGDGDAAMRAFAMINLIVPVLSWRLPELGALVLHSGAVLAGDRGFVLVGQAGAGKSTFVEHAIAGGARAVSEDLNLLVEEAGEWRLAGSPFRTRIHRGPGPGRWPLAALLLPSHAAAARIEPVASLIAGAQVQANLPFVGDCWLQVPGGEPLTASLDRIPALRLHFAKDPAFVPLLEAWRPGD